MRCSTTIGAAVIGAAVTTVALRPAGNRRMPTPVLTTAKAPATTASRAMPGSAAMAAAAVMPREVADLTSAGPGGPTAVAATSTLVGRTLAGRTLAVVGLT